VHNIEVDNKAQFLTGEFQIRKKLGLMQFGDAFPGCLEFNHNSIFYQQVEFVACINADAIIVNCKRQLRDDSKTTPGQFVYEALLIHTLHQSRPKFRVDLDGSTDNCTAYLIQFHVSSLL
jgi:hypothetical protein